MPKPEARHTIWSHTRSGPALRDTVRPSPCAPPRSLRPPRSVPPPRSLSPPSAHLEAERHNEGEGPVEEGGDRRGGRADVGREELAHDEPRNRAKPEREKDDVAAAREQSLVGWVGGEGEVDGWDGVGWVDGWDGEVGVDGRWDGEAARNAWMWAVGRMQRRRPQTHVLAPRAPTCLPIQFHSRRRNGGVTSA